MKIIRKSTTSKNHYVLSKSNKLVQEQHFGEMQIQGEIESNITYVDNTSLSAFNQFGKKK